MLQIYYPRLTCPDERFIYSMLLSGSRCPRDLCVAQSGDEALTMARIAAAERLERDRTRVVRGLSNESSLVVDHRFPGFPPPPPHRSAMLHPSQQDLSQSTQGMPSGAMISSAIRGMHPFYGCLFANKHQRLRYTSMACIATAVACVYSSTTSPKLVKPIDQLNEGGESGESPTSTH